MARMTVRVTPDGMKQMRGTPARGLLELVKNALDSDATGVDVSFVPNAFGGTAQVVVTDNGNGMTPQEVEMFFRDMGSSWKHSGSTLTTTPSGRELLGRRGRGRFNAFGLGGPIRWDSVARGTLDRDLDPPEGARVRTVVTWRDDEIEFDAEITDAGCVDTGTTVTVLDAKPTADALTSRHGRDELARHLADYLFRYPEARVTVDGKPLTYTDLVSRSTPVTVDITEVKAASSAEFAEFAEFADTATIQVIEWSAPVAKSRIWLADSADTTPRESAPMRITAPGITFSARVEWDGVPRLIDGLRSDDPTTAFNKFMKVIREAIRDLMRQRAREVRSELLPEWRAEGSYPYQDDVEGAVEMAERDLFDIVALTAAPAFSEAKPAERAFVLRLIKATVRSDADDLRRVLEQVLGLDAGELADLDAVLQRIPLTSMLAVNKVVTDRVVFLDWLENILNDEIWTKKLTERNGLQDLMEANTWVFGDMWQTMAADRGLKHALTRLAKSGYLDIEKAETVYDADGTLVRVDLLLARSSKALNRRQYLVIELKRPSHGLTKADYDQLDNYISTVMADPQFADGRIDWTFILVGRSADEYVNRKRSSLDRPYGLADTVRAESGATYKLWVRTWAEVVEDARDRTAYVREHLGDFPRQADMDALTKAHEHLITDEDNDI